MTKILSGVTIALLIALALIFKLYTHEKEERIKAVAAFNQVTLTLEVERANIKEQSTRLNELNESVAKIRTERDIINNQLNGYRDREILLQKKPKTIERLANAATKRMFNDIRTSTSRGDKAEATKPITSTND